VFFQAMISLSSAMLCYFKAGNYHQACTKMNIYGGVNENCASKNYSEERWETDPLGYSMLEIYDLKMDY
jgi:hypothetical protein